MSLDAPDAPTHHPGISGLPTELLIAIFAHYAAEEPLASVNTRSVCRRWMHITDSASILWKRICLDHTKLKTHTLHQQAKLYLEKSKPFLLDVEVRTHDPDRMLSLLSPLLPSVSRWRTFSTVGFRSEHVTMADLPHSSQVQVPIPLDRLVLLMYEYDVEELDDDVGTNETITTDDVNSLSAKRFPTFTADGQMYLRQTALPSRLELAPLHFTHLTISEGFQESTQTNAAAILDLLRACPALRVFLFEGWQHDNEPLTYPVPLPLVSLPYLEVLHIRTTCIIRRLLSRLHTPLLHTLILAYLNVDFRAQSAEYAGDEGDSEDEAHDFSQSPWSDHATGMGLRSLLARSRPPLRTLEMDYSDMRTKDFQWVFDRLHDLEEFRIVASDMSNKVIELLRPVYKKQDNGTQSVSVRCPRLRKLCLDHCQRVSGDALVGALVARAAFTDSAGDGYSKLASIRVTGCEQVDVRHEELLNRALGRRFIC